MKKLNYYNTGNFTKKQEKLCQEIAERIKELQKSGCDVIAKQDSLQVYKTREIEWSYLLNPGMPYSYDNPIPYLSAGRLNDSGADDAEYFVDDAFEDEENED